MWIEILVKKSKSFLIGTIYRPPVGSKYLPKDFSVYFEDMLSTAAAENKILYTFLALWKYHVNLLLQSFRSVSLRIESSAIINLRGVPTKLKKYIVFTMQTYKKRYYMILITIF